MREPMSWDKFIGMIINHREDKNEQSSDRIFRSRRTLHRYQLGQRYGELYFTTREGECMLGLLSGKTIVRVAAELELSPRTVEFYLKNMKSKLGCRTKSELIRLILKSDFMTNYEKTRALKSAAREKKVSLTQP